MTQVAFTSPSVLIVRGQRRISTCSRRQLRTPIASTNQYGTPAEWKTAGNGISPQGMRTVEFIIRQDGRVEEKVTGMKGADCLKVLLSIFFETNFVR